MPDPEQLPRPYPLTGESLSFVPECGHCCKRDVPLKKCAGCGIRKYCSRECQKASWSTHKLMCRSEDANPMKTAITPADVGHSSGMSLGRAVDRWSNMHSFTCAIIAHIETVGSENWSLPADGPRVLLFGLVSRTPHEAVDSPSAEFRIDTHYIRHQRTYIEHGIYIVASQWTPGATRRRERLAETVREEEKKRTGEGPKLAGVLPVTVYLVGTGMVMEDPCRIYYPHGLEPAEGVDLFTLVGLKMLMYLCLEVINLGYVLRPRDPDDTSSRLPRIGKYVQRKKKWRWQPAEDAWHAVARVLLQKYCSILPPSEIFAVYHKLWPHGMPGNSVPEDEMD